MLQYNASFTVTAMLLVIMRLDYPLRASTFHVVVVDIVNESYHVHGELHNY